jgi:hypothetical protein
MVVLERSPGQSVQIGPWTVRVLAVHANEVVFALLDPDRDCAVCGEQPAEGHCCSLCGAEAVLCSACAVGWRCPDCASEQG